MNKLLLKLKSKIMAFRDMFKDDNDINEKTQNEWEMVTEDGTPFTIYDYKEYRDYEDYEKIGNACRISLIANC